jgi:ribonuclease-3
MPDAEPVDRLAQRLGFGSRAPALLVQALTHRSWCAENEGAPSNERLEFLGDAVLGMVVAERGFTSYPELPEGALAKVRSDVVNASVLAGIASEVGLGGALLLGKGEDASGGREKASILADALEAVIGAVYIERGWEHVERLVLELLGERIDVAAAGPGAKDFKTRLQELSVRRHGVVPRYEVSGTGPDHARRYSARVSVGGGVVGEGSGNSKKDAEQEAAMVAWRQLVGDQGEREGSKGEGSAAGGSAAGGPAAGGPAAGGPAAGGMGKGADA